MYGGRGGVGRIGPTLFGDEWLASHAMERAHDMRRIGGWVGPEPVRITWRLESRASTGTRIPTPRP
jgi:hypothetical protein